VLKVQSVAMYHLVSVFEQLPFNKVSSIAFNCQYKFVSPRPKIVRTIIMIKQEMKQNMLIIIKHICKSLSSMFARRQGRGAKSLILFVR